MVSMKSIVKTVIENLAEGTVGYSNPYVTDDPKIYIDGSKDDVTSTATSVPTTLFPETCGGELIATATAQQFASPGLKSGGYSDGLTCIWNIVSYDGSPVFLSFYSFELEGLYLGQCVDSVTVRQGSVDGRTLGFYCGTKYSPGWDAFTSIVSTQSNITVIFETDDSITDIGFLANYKIGVDGLECSSNPCQNGGTCQEGELSYTCECKEFTLGDHCEAEDICALSGECVGEHESCVTTSLYSECVCDEGYVGHGCEVYTVCDANGLELSATTTWQSLASPNYPNLYPDNTDCTWTIRAPQADQKISMWLQSVHMEESADGCHDELIIMNGVDDSILQTLCGHNIHEYQYFTLHTHLLKLEFSSDYSFQDLGFLLSYQIAVDYCAENSNSCELYQECVNRVDSFECQCPQGFIGDTCSIPNSCGGTLTAEAAPKQFATTNYPENYENSQTCTWVISAAAGRGIRLDVQGLELEECFDTVTIYEGSTAAGSPITELCGISSSGESFLSTTNAMTVVFQSDYSFTLTGMLANYIEVTDVDECTSGPCQNSGVCTDEAFSYSCECSGNFAGPNCEYVDGNSCAPNPCAEGATCVDGVLEYICQCPEGKVGVNCELDDPCVGVECHNGGTCEVAPSGSDFSCKCPENYAGELCAIYTACRGNISLGVNETWLIGTPGYGDLEYSNNMNCTWDITASQNSYIVATFETFYLEEGCYDRFNIEGTDLDEVLLCPGDGPDYYTPDEDFIAGNSMTIQFVSDDSVTAPGAVIRLQLDPDDCQNNNCVNGQCVDGKQSYTCDCDPGFLGDTCNGIDECASNPCVNGECVDAESSYTCLCDSGFMGTQCESTNPDCVGHLCENGACVVDPAGVEVYACRCNVGWTGQYCNETSCGTKGSGGSQKIVSGKESVPNEWPWQAVLLKDNPNSWVGSTMFDLHYCGGTLISDRHVITAAHCGVQVGDYVALGAHDLTGECTDSCVVVRIARVVKHENYDLDTNDNDIAIIELESSVTMSENVNQICLPSSSDSFASGTALTITGWGDTQRIRLDDDQKAPIYPATLQEADIELIDEDMCEKLLNDFTSNMICARDLSDNTPPDTCHGDSGGPAQAEINGKWTLVGVTSWGHGCGDINSPGAYTKVTNFITWIENNK